MRNIIFRIFLALLFFIAPSSLFALSYQSLEKGLDYAVWTSKGSDLFKLHLFKIDLHRYKIKVLNARDHQLYSMTSKEFTEKNKALLSWNANFFDERSRPLGAVLQDGKLVSHPKHTPWYAALLLKGDEGKIEKTYQPSEFLKFENGLQAGPRLVVQGKPLKLKPEISPKTAIGFDEKGILTLIVSEGSIEINQLAKILSTPVKQGGIGLKSALNLDGGSSTQLYAKKGKFELWIPGLTKVPIAMGVFKK